MTLPTHKLCPSCGATKPAEDFGRSTQANGKQRLNSYCRACRTAKQRERLATPEGRAKHTEAKRAYLATPEGREVNRKSAAKHQARHRARFAAAFDHFEGRRGWEWIVAGVLTRHPQARAIQVYNDRFEQMAAWYVGDEEEPWVAEGDLVLLQAA